MMCPRIRVQTVAGTTNMTYREKWVNEARRRSKVEGGPIGGTNVTEQVRVCRDDAEPVAHVHHHL